MNLITQSVILILAIGQANYLEIKEKTKISTRGILCAENNGHMSASFPKRSVFAREWFTWRNNLNCTLVSFQRRLSREANHFDSKNTKQIFKEF